MPNVCSLDREEIVWGGQFTLCWQPYLFIFPMSHICSHHSASAFDFMSDDDTFCVQKSLHIAASSQVLGSVKAQS